MDQLSHEGYYIPLRSLVKLRYYTKNISLASINQVATQNAGGQASATRGRGVDFSDVRIYQAGDDIRHMDWRITARTGKPHTKLYHEERERPVFFLVDDRCHMHFGTKNAFKSVIAAQVTALLAWTAIQQGNRVGAMIMRDKERIELQPRGTVSAMLRLLHELSRATHPESFQSQKQPLEQALTRLHRMVKPGSLVFILSDFLNISLKAEKYLSQLRQYNEVCSIFVYDQIEKEPPPPGRYRITDATNFTSFNTNDTLVCEHYRKRFPEHLNHLHRVMQKRNIPLLEIATHDNIIQLMQHYFARKSTRPLSGLQSKEENHGSFIA